MTRRFSTADLENLTKDTALIISASGRPLDAWETHSSDLPAVVIATGEQVRAARKTLRES